MILDFKTGARDPLKLAGLSDGDGVQLALYVLAMQAGKAGVLGASRVSPLFPLDDAPQISAADVKSLETLWSELARMEQTGVFGWHGSLRSEYGVRSTYPLATLAVDPGILDAKWERTHPNLSTGRAK
jgi:hypothetical protein